jgi:hypothetical protein
MGSEVADLSVPGWKISSAAVESSIELLKEVLEENWEGDTIVIYQIFDNTSFFSIGTDDTAAMPVKSGKDGKYHIVGALGMVDRDDFKQQFSLAVPLFRAGGFNKKVIISPLMRYAVESCCDSALHCTNRGPALNKVLSEGLATLETWIDDQAFLKRIRNFLVLNPNLIIAPDHAQKKDARTFKAYWKDGPVHMASAGYEKLAAGIVEELASATFSRPVNTELIEATGKSEAARGRGIGRGRGQIDLSTRRQNWVCSNDAVVHRTYSEERGRGSGRGRGGYRGRVRGLKIKRGSFQHYSKKPY